MPSVKSEKQYNNFTKGLITEASSLSFPENAALDLDNLILERTGKVSRRLGVDYEIGYTLTPTGLDTTILSSTKVSVHKWPSPDGDTTVSIGVIRIYNKLWFIDLLRSSPSSHLLNAGNSITVSGLTNGTIETAIVNNKFIIVSEDIDYPILFSFDRTTQLVTSEIIPIQVRDIWGVVDSLPVDTRPSVLTNEHNYNLINQGWSPSITSKCGTVSTDTVTTKTAWVFLDRGWSNFFTPGIFNRAPQPGPDGRYGWYKTSTVIVPGVPISVGAIECTKTSIGVYPSNCDVWTLGKVGDASSADFEKYDPAALKKNSIYKVEAPKGAFTIDAFDRGEARQSLTGITSLSSDSEQGRLTTVAAFAGRLFYSGINSVVIGGDGKSPNYSSYIFFSQVATSKDVLGKCYQEADPTNPEINDIVDTDGGTIQIPEVTKIVKLLSTRTSLIIFAQNGVWEVFGDTGGFTATSYQISKISSIGTESPRSIVEFNQGVAYWSKAGIFLLTQDPISGRYQAENLTIQTIQSFYNTLTSTTRDNTKGFYDEQENRIRWLYNDTSDYSESNYINNYNRELVLDLTLKSFYPNTIGEMDNNPPFVCDYIELPKYVSSTTDNPVYVGVDPIMVGLEAVYVAIGSFGNRSSQFSFLTLAGTSFTVSQYIDTSFMDWKSVDNIGVDYSSYIVTGYELFGDIMRRKQVPYLLMCLEKTEDGFSLDTDGNLQLDNPSSCLVQAQWNWANSANSGKWGTQFQAYKFRRNYTPIGSADTFDYGEAVIVSKNKLRGSGKALSLKIQSETGKDMRVLGWGVSLTGGNSV